MPQTEIPNILSTLTFLPLVGAMVVMCLPRPRDIVAAGHGHGDDHVHGVPETRAPYDPNRPLVNGVAFITTLLAFLLSLVLFFKFNSSLVDVAGRNMQFVENASWITFGTVNIRYHLGIDGISLLLIVLTTFLSMLCVLFSTQNKERLKEFMVFLLMLETGMIGVFCSLDLVLFYVFWEAMLIPMYFLIGIFGHENRVYAAVKFFLFTFAGSVLMLIAIISTYNAAGTLDVVALSNPASAAAMKLHHLDPQALLWMFGAFSLAFMIKVPMFPFHTWLPDAHVEAPTAGSVILAGVMLKMGTYGFVRFCLPLFPDQAQLMAPLFITLSIIGIVYASIVAAVQPDAKKLVAYSSVAHLGFVVLGIFTFTRVGMMGALVQNINHGISTPMLFFIVGMLYERRHTRQISEYGGLKKYVPLMATMLLIATLASVAVPFFNGFVGEFPILQGTYISSITGIYPTAIAATGMILSAVYMLWWFQRLMLGPVTNDVNKHLPDLNKTEIAVLVPLVIVVFWFGLGSPYWTHRMETAVNLEVPVESEKINEDLPIVRAQLLDRVSHDRLVSRGSHDEEAHLPMVIKPEMEIIKFKDIPPPKPPTVRATMKAGASAPASGGGGGRRPAPKPKAPKSAVTHAAALRSLNNMKLEGSR
jgi:NADH-quinone oxidoreductase subunit M